MEMMNLFVSAWMFVLLTVTLGLLVPVSIMAWREVLKGRK